MDAFDTREITLRVQVAKMEAKASMAAEMAVRAKAKAESAQTTYIAAQRALFEMLSERRMNG